MTIFSEAIRLHVYWALPVLTCVGMLGWCCFSRATDAPCAEALNPRGTTRILYCHDSGILSYNLWDPFSPDQLRAVVDGLADNGVDLYAQLIYSGGRVRLFRPQTPGVDELKMGRLEATITSGIQPIEVLIDQAHKRGIQFLAKFRMSDRHSTTGHGFIAQHPELQLEEFSGAPDYRHEQVRQHFWSTMEEIVRRFDVDGFELNFIRAMHCFPTAVARDSHPIMTDFVKHIRNMLDEAGAHRNRKLLLGARVPQTLEECRNLGFDLPTWVADGLIDYLAPSDSGCSDFNAPYEDFAALTRRSPCMLYPTVHPPMIRSVVKLMTPANYRALARTMYASGADGISVFNFMYHWAARSGLPRYDGPETGYPLALSVLRDLRDPQKLATLSRHYAFLPLWEGTCPTGAVKNDRLVLSREQSNPGGEYLFRLFEKLDQVTVTLFFRAEGLTPKDKIQIDLNGKTVIHERVVRLWNVHGRWDRGVQWQDPRHEAWNRRWKFERPLRPFTTFWFDLRELSLITGTNRLGLHLVESDSDAKDPIVVDEVEVTAVPIYRNN